MGTSNSATVENQSRAWELTNQMAQLTQENVIDLFTVFLLSYLASEWK